MEQWPFVSILTLNWNAKETTLQWLSHLKEIDYPKDRLEIVIHDNASVDGSQRAFRTELEKMKDDGWRNLILIESPEHPGVTEAFNRAFAKADDSSKYILRLDNDVHFDRNALRIMAETMERSPRTGVLGCRIVLYRKDMNGTDQTIFTYGAIFVNEWTGRTKIVDMKHIAPCDIVLGAVMLVRREVVKKLQFFFDPSLFFFHDEGDLCLRVKKLGYEILYTPEAISFHEFAQSSGKTPNLCRYLNMRNGIILMKSSHSPLRYHITYYLLLLLEMFKSLMKMDKLALRALKDGFLQKQLDAEWWKQALKHDLKI